MENVKQDAEDQLPGVDEVMLGVAIEERRPSEVLVGIASVSWKGAPVEEEGDDGVVLRKEMEIRVYELTDTSKLLELEGILLRNGPRCVMHTVVALTDETATSLQRLVDDDGYQWRTWSESSFGKKKRRDHVQQSLSRMVGAYDHRLVDSDVTLAAVGCALEVAEVGESGADDTLFVLVGGKVSDAMRLDNSAVRAATVFSSEDSDVSVMSVLDATKTNLGKRELERRLRKPSIDQLVIEKRLDAVEELVQDGERRELLRERLSGVPDVAKLATKLRKRTAKLVDIHRIHQFLAKQLPPLAEVVPDLRKPCRDAEKFAQMARHALDLSYLPEVFIRAEIDEDLVERADSMRDARRAVDDAHERAAESWAVDVAGRASLIEDKAKWPLKLEKDSTDGFVLRSPKAYDEKTIANHSDETLAIVSYLKNGVYVTTAALGRATKAYAAAKRDYEQAQAKLTADLVETAATYAPVLEGCAALMADVDATQSIAHTAVFAVGGPYCRPIISNRGVIKLRAARHPCVEQCTDHFIANDYDLGDPHKLALVTGPNMGGKSTYIRAVAAIAIMAQAGAFVPAEEAELPLFDALLARVGAGDNLQRGVSTFMAEMVEAATILDLATSRSLVVVDELGRGTSTCDGFGLAWAIAHRLATHNDSLSLFATHFHELTDLENALPGVVKNLHVTATADLDAITFLYNIRRGPCHDSFGIAVAKLAGFPDRAIQVAKAKAQQLENLDDETEDSQYPINNKRLRDIS